MTTTHYTATVEVATKKHPDVDGVLEQLQHVHGSIGAGPRGWLFATVTLPAESLTQACTLAAALVGTVYGADPIACEVLTEDERDAREGWGPALPDLVSVSEAAEILGVSRQAVLDRVGRGTLPATRVGRDYVIPRDAVRGTR